jgi:hypothetical protein
MRRLGSSSELFGVRAELNETMYPVATVCAMREEVDWAGPQLVQISITSGVL